MNKKQLVFYASLVSQSAFVCFFLSFFLLFPNPDEHRLYIFIHGTVKPPEIPFSSIFQIMRDEIDSLMYKDVVEHLRHDAYYCRGQAMQAPGLHPIIIDFCSEQTTSQTIAQMYNMQLEQQGVNTQNVLYYTFGWSGLLSDKKRYEAAVDFYKQLHNELTRLATQKIFPHIYTIGFSHGGNVLLYLPEVRKRENMPFFTIKELITLATPIQKDTSFFVFDDMFQSVYNFYSLDDGVQTADIFSSRYQFFSKRTFFTENKKQLPEKITQVRIRVVKKFKKEHLLPEEKTYMILADKRYKPLYKDPCHSELWCFKSCTQYYRTTFPLKPFPVMVFLPTIIHSLKTTCPHLKHLTCTLAPSLYGMLFSTKDQKYAIPFIKKTIYEHMHIMAQLFEQTYCDYESQREHTNETVERARKKYIERTKKIPKKQHREHPRRHRRLYLKKYRTTLHNYAATYNLLNSTTCPT